MSAEQLYVDGRFWNADDPTLVVPGRLRLGPGRPRLELFGALSPWLQEVASASSGQRHFIPAPIPRPRTIHGSMIGRPARVTLIGAFQVRHKAKAFSVPSAPTNEGLQQETLEAEYAIEGLHVADADAVFTGFRFRIVHQDPWAFHTGLSMRHASDGSNRTDTIEHTLPDDISEPLPTNAGTLALQAEASVSPARIAGAYVLTRTWLKVSLESGVTVHGAWERYVVAASDLLTMLHDKDCSPTDFKVRDPDTEQWCRIHIPGLVADPCDVRDSKLPEPALLNRETLGLERLAAWFELAARLSPLPRIVAGAIQTPKRAVQNLLLELATTAEGLHRRLHPDARRLTEKQKEEALAALANLQVSPEAKEVLINAMGTYLWEVSFPSRLRALADEVAAAVPGVTGRTNRWCQAMVNARNGFAHSLGGGVITVDAIYEYHTLQASLRWLLIGRLLVALGVPADDLAIHFPNFSPYSRFLENAKRALPAVYQIA